MKGLILNFYSVLFSDDGFYSDNKLPSNRFPKVEKKLWDKINAPFKTKEIRLYPNNFAMFKQHALIMNNIHILRLNPR